MAQWGMQKKMKFTYTYRSSDGQRHVGEIEAESRDAAFAAIRREMGVKPIRVTAAGGEESSGGGIGKDSKRTTASGEDGKPKSGRAALVAAVVLVVAAIAGGAWWWAARRADANAPYTVTTPQGTVTYTVAQPLSRQPIPGNRERIDDGRSAIFTNDAERFLARFAEPGRAVQIEDGKREAGNGAVGRPTDEDFVACLNTSVRVASNELTEHIDLKRIVAGLKREMRAYLAGGGTVEQYLDELAKRQRLEISYRENAEQKLAAMLEAARKGTGETAGAQRQDVEAAQRKAYGYWLKANAQLQAMGIYPLALPDSLRSYQMGLDIEE